MCSTRFALFLSSMLFLPGFVCAQESPSVKDIVQRESSAIVSVYNLDARGEVRGTGTGFIVRAEGIVVTNFHVIEGARGALIKLKNGEVYDRVWVIDFHARRDIAVLKIQAVGLPTVTLGDSSAMEQGDWCVAIGNPKGLEHTVSDGLISAIRIMEGNQMLQISAPISPGSSGGPLYNRKGEVVGITTAALVGQGVQNLNFAVPIKYVLPMLETNQRLTLAEVAAQAPPAKADGGDRPAAAGDTYTDPSGIATITVEPGWTASPPSVQGSLMTLTKGACNYQIMFMAGFSNVESLFKIGENSSKSAMKKFKKTTERARADVNGEPVLMQFFSGEAQRIKMSAFVGARVTSKGGFLGVAYLPETENQHAEAITKMFLSLR
jgi:S1-C subfamily serine protease